MAPPVTAIPPDAPPPSSPCGRWKIDILWIVAGGCALGPLQYLII